MIHENLIIDVGMHKGEDTSFFLSRGYNVIAIDAVPELIEGAKNTFSKYIAENKLTLLNYAISDKENEKVHFNISENSLWNSLKSDISNRKSLLKYSIEVDTLKLSSIIKKYGVPYYCKIDIEGFDEVALKTLMELKELPKYISVESECIGENDAISDEEALLTLHRLRDLGYTNFKLVDQYTLKVLSTDITVYKQLSNNLVKRILAKLRVINRTYRQMLSAKFKYEFPFGSSGPFGEDLSGHWLDFEVAKLTLLKHRHDFQNIKSRSNYGFWCDWHATLS